MVTAVIVSAEPTAACCASYPDIVPLIVKSKSVTSLSNVNVILPILFESVNFDINSYSVPEIVSFHELASLIIGTASPAENSQFELEDVKILLWKLTLFLVA